MKIAALDLGTNTFLLFIADVINNKITKIYRDELSVVRLGQGVHATKSFHPDALLRAEECLREYSEIIQEEMPERTIAFATSAARDVVNGQQLFDLGRKYNIPIDIIPGELEARVTFDGATFDYEDKNGLVVIDVGGGSTEVIGLDKNHQPFGASLDIGSVRLTEMFITNHPIPSDEIANLEKFCQQAFDTNSRRLPRGKIKEVIAVAGTPTTMAAVLQGKPYTEDEVHGFQITLPVLEEWIKKMSKMDLNSRKHIPGMDPRRADVIVAGSIILKCALNFLGVQKLTVSARGVRYGVALWGARQQ